MISPLRTPRGRQLRVSWRWMMFVVLLGGVQCEQETRAPFCRLDAAPNPARRCEGDPPAATHLSWFCESPVLRVEVRVGSREGRIFAQTGPYGHSMTGLWLNKPTEVFLVQMSNQEVLAQIMVEVESLPCRE